MTGTIKKKTDRGFGFIAIEGAEKDLFFHSSALTNIAFDELQEGTTVTFDVQDGDNGRQSAINVMVAGQGDSQESPAEESEPAAVESAPAEDAEQV